ncbi:MAG TPA: MoaD/ThiS family protein [Marmoricola sp.]|nr:MoaD/ThiS family protein [Marmoricola sp.]HNI71422.1 MoaD/ThiS family protein [Marmoricola sp.]HNJ79890.1 MoaD/ThiS family protein [Marmoricola sp.]HNN49054.1 MoaD/ThiS family protein [Marmoricola sp.]HNO38996.1 MoaD/ThiS family protein [Marmoricola sp.]
MTTPDAHKTVRLRYWAAAAHAAGTEIDEIAVTGPVTLSRLTEQASSLHPDRRFADVLATCSVLVGDQPVSSGEPDQVLIHPGQQVEFLPPFAGG